MIVPMKHLDLVCVASERDATLERLRALGYAQTQLEKLAGLNLWRVLKRADAARK